MSKKLQVNDILAASDIDYIDTLENENAKLREKLDSANRENEGVKNFLTRYRYRMKGGEVMQAHIDDVLQGRNGFISKSADEFVIEQQIKALNWVFDNVDASSAGKVVLSNRIEKLRKELKK